MSINFKDAYAANQLKPAVEVVEVTPSDVTIYDPPLRAAKVTGAGNINVEFLNGNVGVVPMEAYVRDDFYIVRLLATGTTATGIYGYK